MVCRLKKNKLLLGELRQVLTYIKVHADASNFDEGVSKEDAYEQVLLQAEGFYVLDPSSAKPQLILGPFQGKVACQIIAFGRGVCGVAAESQTTQLVQDVERFPGHIACDSESKSEIVVPIVAVKDGAKKVVAIIDVDCAELHGFDEVDKKNLEQLAELIGKSCDW
ncbi:Free methionine-R-sulfoxide reductase [Beauveria bassiana]|uniref:Free methionine-R-sulfoxide reductase n=1 Tax=Beauveria bassiana TaxID=176275 RepID=A0A2N6NJ02_BEABA|nr:Free methionine-R-sulfoxide reductase [Beauveria bassiana]